MSKLDKFLDRTSYLVIEPKAPSGPEPYEKLEWEHVHKSRWITKNEKFTGYAIDRNTAIDGYTIHLPDGTSKPYKNKNIVQAKLFCIRHHKKHGQMHKKPIVEHIQDVLYAEIDDDFDGERVANRIIAKLEKHGYLK